MLAWFREVAPIKRKLMLAFGILTLLVGIGLMAGWWALWCLAASAPPAALASAETGLAVVSAAVLIASVVLGRIFARAIFIPYVETVVRMEALALGDTAAPIRFSAYKDCVGRMARAMEIFRENAIARGKAEAEAQAIRAAAVQTQREAEAAAIAAQTTMIVGSIGAALKRLSSGDFTQQLDAALPEDYEPLRQNLNTATQALQDLLRKVSANTTSLQSGCAEIAHAADDLSRRTEQQAASLEQTAAALDQITATVQKTAENAKHAHSVVSDTRVGAARSGEIVGQAVAAMDEIEKSSQQIGQIIGVIDEIAFQTNLLALNAGVEAARAGDAGRGFAVVASEVRGLAQRSAAAAKEIKALVSTSSKQVGIGVKLVGETGGALNRIVQQVVELSGVVSDISASAQEQSTALREVNSAINQMDQVTQQNAAMVEQTTAASHSLTQDAGELLILTHLFRVNEGDLPNGQPNPSGFDATARATKPRFAKPGSTTPKSIKPVATKVSPSSRDMTPRAAVSASRKTAVAVAEDWTEF